MTDDNARADNAWVKMILEQAGKRGVLDELAIIVDALRMEMIREAEEDEDRLRAEDPEDPRLLMLDDHRAELLGLTDDDDDDDDS